MKWFQLDSNAPSDPKIRRVIRQFGNAGFGALVRLWCFTAGHGALAGHAVDSNGRPYDREELADAAGCTVEKLDALLAVCAEQGHIDPRAWAQQRRVIFPAMARRADETTKKRAREHRENPAPIPELLRNDSGTIPPTVQDSTVQDSTVHNNTAPLEGAPVPPSRAELERWFTDAFWPAYPNKVAKPVALKALLKLKPDAAMRQRILDGVARWAASRKWAEGFVEHPATFLNQHRFNDAPMPDRAPRQPAMPLPVVGQTGAASAGKYAHLMRRDEGVH